MRIHTALGTALLVVGMAWPPLLATEEATAVSAPSIVRFRQVERALYRGGQPDAGAFEQLKRLGIRTVVNLRRSDAQRRTVEALGLRYVDLSTGVTPFGLSGGIKDEVVRRFFEVVDDPGSGPLFLHCRRGADRTGAVIAMYRIARQGWTAEAAFEEARTVGMRWWHFPVKGQLEAFTSQHATRPERPRQA
jgi:protein tyrosine phosphatase (PTP) superfamily phosphohydrolase (DUF442 family)